MARIICILFSLTHLPISAAQSYTSLEDMPAWKTLPPVASYAVKYATSVYYVGCVTAVPQISTAACYETLPAMSSSLLSNIVWPGFWNPSVVPTQFQASATSVAKEWYGQPAVKAAIGTQTPTPTSSNPILSSSPTTSDSVASTDTPTPARKGFQSLSTTAQVFTILGPIVTFAGILVAIILDRKGKLPFRRNRTVGTQNHRRWPSDGSDDHQGGATNTMNSNNGRGHLVSTTNSGPRNHTSTRIGDRLNIHVYGGGGRPRDETPIGRYPRRPEPVRTSDDVSDGSVRSNWTPITGS